MATPAESLLHLSDAPPAVAVVLALSLAGCTDDASPLPVGGWDLSRDHHRLRRRPSAVSA